MIRVSLKQRLRHMKIMLFYPLASSIYVSMQKPPLVIKC